MPQKLEKPPVAERISAAFPKLRAAAKELNTASDELAKAIAPIEKILQPLSLGVTTWAQISGNEELDGQYWSRDVGYTKIAGEWRIAVRTTSGHHNFDHHDETEWAFNDAPRWMRIEAVTKLPDLLEQLVERVVDTTKKIRAKTKQASEIAEALAIAARAETDER